MSHRLIATAMPDRPEEAAALEAFPDRAVRGRVATGLLLATAAAHAAYLWFHALLTFGVAVPSFITAFTFSSRVCYTFNPV